MVITHLIKLIDLLLKVRSHKVFFCRGAKEVLEPERTKNIDSSIKNEEALLIRKACDTG